ncbi:acetate/propionate family kinase [Pseudohoeflea suaedae]|uniref:Acetate kinase n=1 Tax=Pseudohoeflea suaedae TaxID=877384 RepID=A0A4R5PLS3_9HYPH|nr:acetate/propionate family kinase [Pseudohoeflea suaedae]TDH37904.1 acetate/propionate family kinase [Pseudohoeflea suaedae]
MTTPAILVLNSGSSSIKFSIFAFERDPSAADLVCGGKISGIGVRARLDAENAKGEALAARSFPSGVTYEELLGHLLDWIEEHLDGLELVAAGHRVVHGGKDHVAPAILDDSLRDDLRALTPLAPLHQPHNLDAIDALARLHPELAQIASFDTAFHAGRSEIESVFALPAELAAEGVRRYGFHGLSYDYIASRLAPLLGDAGMGRVIVAHLGSGASLCAMSRGRSVATTMGFSVLDGLPMGTRCGQIDPGVLLYLMQEKRMNAEELTRLLYRQSGLLGLSGISSDMRELLASDRKEARFAIDHFCYRANREIGSLAATLGGIDALVFTAGIGEHSPDIRRRICASASWLGIEWDDDLNRNASGEAVFSTPDSKVAVAVIPTNEELVIARDCWGLLGGRDNSADGQAAAAGLQ